MKDLPRTFRSDLFNLLEKFVVVYKSIEVFTTMFDFFKDVRNEIATLHAKIDALVNIVEGHFRNANQAAPVDNATAQPAPTPENTDAQ